MTLEHQNTKIQKMLELAKENLNKISASATIALELAAGAMEAINLEQKAREPTRSQYEKELGALWDLQRQADSANRLLRAERDKCFENYVSLEREFLELKQTLKSYQEFAKASESCRSENWRALGELRSGIDKAFEIKQPCDDAKRIEVAKVCYKQASDYDQAIKKLGEIIAQHWC